MPAPAKSRVTGLKNKKPSKEATARSKSSGNTTEQSRQQAHPPPPCSPIPHALQQTLLNIFKNAFADRLQSDIHPLLQEVKHHLFNRDFSTAFGQPAYLEAYAARWSPSRALGYLDVLWELRETLGLDGKQVGEADTDADADVVVRGKEKNVLCLGGGAGAEVVALGGLMKMVRDASTGGGGGGGGDGDSGRSAFMIRTTALDIASWDAVITALKAQLTMPPPISKYASAAVREANTALLPASALATTTFTQADALAFTPETLAPLLVDTTLVTLLFTLNELYSASLPLTQRLLHNLTQGLRVGSHLLVIDSPGSYSSVALGGKEKEYPMAWLLDYTLLAENRDGSVQWEKVRSEEGRWFRLSEALEFPVKLENMRMQVHLYRRV